MTTITCIAVEQMILFNGQHNARTITSSNLRLLKKEKNRRCDTVKIKPVNFTLSFY